ncbi:helix-turn-helix domain-containing protein [Clostridium felsineum]|uniref:helix-turn-helix domain-containing protein n=1 Tax=Clostridium felsineum TaxID=36839 RepID=UPI00098C47AF|nr:helix-turn-helix domain-containing protein [Clostridium felsineum]URZ00532.1 hypothetical protein CLAUR_005200 [Clostridium felsineum]
MVRIEVQSTIRTLFEKGYNKSQIARMLEIDRKTVRKVLNETGLKGFVEHKKRNSSITPYK